MNDALLVPIHLDALLLGADRLMVEAMADFSRLPYVDRQLKREINADNANISESIVSQPFQSQTLNLKAGVHLHWSMPDALTRGIHHGDHTRFRALPNRWLVTRSKSGTKENPWVVEKSWVVESDYVFPLPQKTDPNYEEYALAERERSGAISYFYREIDPDSPEPFRYVGRQLPLDDWLQANQSPSSAYFPADKPLTALGYGEIAFAAFYPNCHSVFGFYDGDVTTKDSGYRYEIVGWHSNSAHNPLKSLLLGEAILKCFEIDTSRQDRDRAGKTVKRDDLLHAYADFDFSHAATETQFSKIINGLIAGDSHRLELHEFLANQSQAFVNKGLDFFQEEPNKEFLNIEKLSDFGWVFPSKLNGSIPKQTLYYSSVFFPTRVATPKNPKPDIKGEVKISIGNTTMEALSAYLAHQIAPEFGIDPDYPRYPESTVGYDLRLVSVGGIDDLEDRGLSLVMVALVNTELRIRIFDSGGAKIIDKPEGDLVPGQELTALKKMLNSGDFPVASTLPQDDKEKLIQNAITIAGYNRMERLEDQLESLHLSGKLANRKLDIGPKFREARHNSGFTPVSGGLRWAVKLQSSPSTAVLPMSVEQNGNDVGGLKNGSAGQAQAQGRVILPPEMTAQLSELNDLQAQYDTAQQKIGTLRKQLFSDWYKYMMSTYHPADTVRGDDYPDVDEVQFFIEEADIKPLEKIIATAKQIETELTGANNRLLVLIKHYNHSPIVHLSPDAPANLTERVKPKPQFTKDAKADGSSTNPAFAQCLSFDGKTSYAATWKAPPLKARRGVTLSAWVQPNLDSSEARTIFSIGELTLQLKPLMLGATPRLTIKCPGVDDRIGVISPQRWHHLAITCQENFDAPSLVVYIDGRRFPLQPSKAVSNKLKNFDSLSIGAAKQDDTAGFRGKMTQVRVDNRVLLSVEVRRDMNGDIRPVYERYTKAAPRYWQPNEPVILMVGKGIRGTERHGQDGRLREDGALECPVIPFSSETSESLESSEDLTVLGAIVPRKTNGVADKEDFASSARAAIESVPSKTIAQNKWNGQPWHPIILEWEVLLQPARGTKDIEGKPFAPNLIIANYDLHDNAVDLKVKRERNDLAAGAVYSNRCYLTPHSGAQLQERIAEYLNAFLDDLGEKIYEFKEQKERETLPADEALNRYHEALTAWFEREELKRVNNEKQPFDLTRGNLDTLKQWYGKKPLYANPATPFDRLNKEQKADDPVYVVICAGLKLFDENGEPLTFLSQSLGGFNDELLMHQHTMQLPVTDPLGFDDYQQFTDKVAELLGDTIHSAPKPTNQFNPIRTGAMSVTRLRLIDTFGQVKDFNSEAILAAGHEIVTPQRLTVPDSPHLTWMPPRLVQPARVDFHWLRSDESDPDATPICGWVLPNNLQKTLAVYDRDGQALGSLLQRGSTVQWEPAPGRNCEVDEIQPINPHLAKMVRHILDKHDGAGSFTAKNFLEDFLTAIESALETIDPESHAQHRSLALLMGRPIAVVRASLDLQLQGAPAVHQGWHAFQTDLRRDTRETDDFTRVKFPVRIGEYQQLNDGVVGYWIEEKIDDVSDDYRYKRDKDSKGEGATFYAPQTPDNAQNRSIDRPDIKIHQEKEPVHILQSIDSPKLTATLLFDPRGKVHLTSGVLPTKVIDIPAEDYAAALEAIEVTFLTAPLLVQHGSRNVSVPDESGFAWSWLEHKRWLDKRIFAESIEAIYAEGYTDEEITALWQRLKASQWIIPVADRPDRARIIPMGRRGTHEKLQAKAGESDLERSELEDHIERLFWAEYTITPVMERQTFLARLQMLSGVADTTLCQSVWDYLLHEEIRWLSATPGDPTRAWVVPLDERQVVDLDLSPEWPAATGKWVDRILNTEALELSPVETQARFDVEQEIREGWLVLKNKGEEP